MDSPTMNANASPMIRSRLQIRIAALGSIGILTPFLPFAWSTSPLSVLVGGTSRPEFKFALIALPWIAIAFGIALVTWYERQGASSAIAALTALQCAYMANAFFCLAVFWPRHFLASSNSGAFVTAITVAIYSAHVALMIVSTNKLKDLRSSGNEFIGDHDVTSPSRRA